MRFGVTLDGLDELRDALKRLPAELNDQVRTVTRITAEECAHEVRNTYAMGPTGNLRAGVGIEQAGFAGRTDTRIVSRAPHAVIYERGTKVRHNKAGAHRGQMPKASARGRSMFPIVNKWRGRLIERLITLVEQSGWFYVKRAA